MRLESTYMDRCMPSHQHTNTTTDYIGIIYLLHVTTSSSLLLINPYGGL